MKLLFQTASVNMRLLTKLSAIAFTSMFLLSGCGGSLFEGDIEHRVRGLLSNVDAERRVINIEVKPFLKRQDSFGEFNLVVDTSTIYAVDGEVIETTESLAALAALPVGSPIVAYGIVSKDDVFTATRLDVGGSVAWSEQDTFRGVISQRDADTVALNGVLLATESKKAAMPRSFIFGASELVE